MINVESLPNPRQIKALHCDDDRGRQSFTGAHRIQDAAAYVPKGAAQWYIERQDGTMRPLPVETPPPKDATPFVAPVAQAPQLDSMRLALEYGEKNAARIAAAYRDAFQIAGQSWANVVAPLTSALQALSSRVVTLEARLEDLPQLQPPDDPEPPQKSALDELAEGVLTGVVQGVASGALKP